MIASYSASSPSFPSPFSCCALVSFPSPCLLLSHIHTPFDFLLIYTLRVDISTSPCQTTEPKNLETLRPRWPRRSCLQTRRPISSTSSIGHPFPPLSPAPTGRSCESARLSSSPNLSAHRLHSSIRTPQRRYPGTYGGVLRCGAVSYLWGGSGGLCGHCGESGRFVLT